MASNEITVQIPVISDSIESKGTQSVSYVIEAPTNGNDKEINKGICNAITLVSACVCGAVFLCFLVVAFIKCYAKYKDLIFERDKLENQVLVKEIADLKAQLAKIEGEKDNEKNKKEFNSLLEKIEAHINSDSKIDVTLKNGTNTIIIKSLDQTKSPAQSNSDDKQCPNQ